MRLASLLVAAGLAACGGGDDTRARAPSGPSVGGVAPSAGKRHCPTYPDAPKGQDFSHRPVTTLQDTGNYTGDNFDGSTISGLQTESLTNFDYATFRGATLASLGLTQATFNYANFEGATIYNDLDIDNYIGVSPSACFVGVHFTHPDGGVSKGYALNVFEPLYNAGVLDFSDSNVFAAAANISFVGYSDLAFGRHDNPALPRARFLGVKIRCAEAVFFKYWDLTEANFTEAKTCLKGLDFAAGVYANAVFDGIDLTGAHFEGADLSGASFQGANLSGAVFTGANLRGALFNGATAVGADFSKTAGLQGANFTNAELSNSTFVGALLDTLTTSTPPIVTAALFTGAHLKNVNFNGARLDGVDFGSASLYGTAQVDGTAPATPCATDVAMCTATRTGMTCGCASASGASMVGTNFTKAFLWGVDFSNGTFGKSLFNQAILVAADFGGANFILDTGKGGGVSQFRQALLQGVALADANLAGASLDGAQVDFGVDGTPFGGNDLMVKLDASYTAFAGWVPPNQPVCVLTVYGRGQPSRLPTAAMGMTCPDGLVHSGGCGANSSTNTYWASKVPIDTGPPQAAYIATPSFGTKGNLESFGCPLSNRSTTW